MLGTIRLLYNTSVFAVPLRLYHSATEESSEVLQFAHNFVTHVMYYDAYYQYCPN